MKVLLISNMPNGADALSAELEGLGVNIVEKEVAGTLDSISNMVGSSMPGGNYDGILVITDNHIAAGIELNKKEGIRAAVCSMPNDVMVAAKSNANVIVVSKESEMRGIAKAVVDSLGRQTKISMRGIVNGIKKHAAKPVQMQKIEGEDAQLRAPRPIGERPKPEAEPKSEEGSEGLQQRKPRRGLFGQLKEALGIEDGKESKNDGE
ncbi:MAG: RpiB/LacA/LacB family sugar-phosphate isomerase [Candidatus Micrarchaeaceae archaeon]